MCEWKWPSSNWIIVRNLRAFQMILLSFARKGDLHNAFLKAMLVADRKTVKTALVEAKQRLARLGDKYSDNVMWHEANVSG